MNRNIKDNGRADVFFLAKKWSGNLENKEPNKCDDLSWFDLDDLHDNIIPYIKQVIDCDFSIFGLIGRSLQYLD